MPRRGARWGLTLGKRLKGSFVLDHLRLLVPPCRDEFVCFFEALLDFWFPVSAGTGSKAEARGAYDVQWYTSAPQLSLRRGCIDLR